MEFDSSTALTVSDIRRAAMSPRTSDSARVRALSALSVAGVAEEAGLMGGVSDRDYLRRLYARRLRRSVAGGSIPHGTEGLVRVLESSTELQEVLVATLEKVGVTAYFFADTKVQWLLGCVVTGIPGSPDSPEA